MSMSIQRQEPFLNETPATPPNVLVILVVDSSDVTGAAIPQFCSYLSSVLDRLYHIHQTYDIRLGQIAFSMPSTSPDHSPIVCQTNFQTPSHVLSMIRDHPSNMGIGQIANRSGAPMAIVDGIIAALEMFDRESSALQSANTSSPNIICHLILATSQPPDKTRRSSTQTRSQFDPISWQTLPTVLQKRYINLSLFLTAPDPSLHRMYTYVAPDSRYMDKPWFPTGGNSVYLMGMTALSKLDTRGSKRSHDVDTVEDPYTRSGLHGADPARTMKRVRPSETPGVFSNPDMQSYHPNNMSRPFGPMDSMSSTINGSNSLGDPHNTFVNSQSLDPFGIHNSGSINMFEHALPQTVASWDASSYQPPPPLFASNGELGLSSNYLSDTAPDSQVQRFDLQYSVPSDPSAELFQTGFGRSVLENRGAMSEILGQNSGNHLNGNLGDNVHGLRDGDTSNHSNPFYDQHTPSHHPPPLEQSQGIGNGNEYHSHVQYLPPGGFPPPDPSLGSGVQLQQGLSSRTGIQASSSSSQFTEHTNYYDFSTYPSQNLPSGAFPPHSVPPPSSVESLPYQNPVSTMASSHASANGAGSPNAQSRPQTSQVGDEGKSLYTLSPKEALAFGPISHPQIPRTVDNSDTFGDRPGNPPVNGSSASTSLPQNLPSSMPSPSPDTPPSSGEDTSGSSADGGDEPFDEFRAMSVLEMVLSGAERHQRNKRMARLRGQSHKTTSTPSKPADTSTPGAGPSKPTHAPPAQSSDLRMLATASTPKASHQRDTPSPAREWTGLIHVDGQSFNDAIHSISIPVSLQGPPLPPDNWAEYLLVHAGTVSGPMDWTAFHKLLDANNITPIPVRLNSRTTGAGATQIEPETQAFLDLISLLQSRSAICRILFDVPGGPEATGMAVYAAPEPGTSSYGLRVACFETIPVPTAEQLSSRPQLFTTSASASSLTGPTLYPTPADIRRISGMNAEAQDSFRQPSSANEISQHGLPQVPNPHPSTSVSPSIQAKRITAAHASSRNEFLSTNVATYPKSLRGPPHRSESPSSPRDNARFSASHRAQFGDQPLSQSSSFEQVSHGNMRTISSPSNDGMGLLGIPPRGSHGEPSPVLNHQPTYSRAFPPADPMQNPIYPLGVNPMTGATLGPPPSQQTAPYQRIMDPHQFSPGQAQA